MRRTDETGAAETAALETGTGPGGTGFGGTGPSGTGSGGSGAANSGAVDSGASGSGSVEYATPLRAARTAPEPGSDTGWGVGVTLGALAVLGAIALLLGPAPSAPEGTGLNPTALGTIAVFAAAVCGWVSRHADDTFVALAAAAAVVVLGALEAEDLFETLGSEQIWLLVAAFVLAAGINRTGLPARVAISMAARAHRPRGLVHLLTAGLVITALLVPSTSGRAALAVPIHRALAGAFPRRPGLVRGLALLFPTVVLLSAIATLVGAGAHLITSQILDSTVDGGIGFAAWLAWGLPLAVASSHLAAEIVLLLSTDHAERATPLRVDAAALRTELGVPARIQHSERRALGLLTAVVLLWCTEPVHGLPPALVALAGALLVTLPRTGTVPFNSAISEIPWSLLLFMAATTALGAALLETGVAEGFASLHGNLSGGALLVSVVVLSAAAHLVLQSRSARSSVLIPLIIPAAAGAGLNPVALAFASTAAAGFCHTLPASAKPVAIFARLDSAPTFAQRDLLRLSAALGPVLMGLVLVFAVFVWPALGLPLR